MKPSFAMPLAVGGGLFLARAGRAAPFTARDTSGPDASTLDASAPAVSDPGTHIPPLHGSLKLKSLPLSPILGRKITTWTYLPPGYDSSNARYPTIYLMHGQPGGWSDCFLSGHVEEMADELIASGQMPPAILVAFDGDGPGGSDDLTNFCNRATDGYRTEDFIANELVPQIDTMYRTRPQASQRALWGYSGGGFGALNLGLHHPDEWKIWASHAGFYRAGEDAKVMTRVLGPKPKNPELWSRNSPLETVTALPDAKGLHVYLDASPKEEDFEGFEAMARELKARGADVEAISRPKAHAWRVITRTCRDSLLFIGRSWG